MKILIACHYYPPHLGGMEIVAQNHAIYLSRFGHEITVVTSDINQPQKERVDGNLRIVAVKALNLFERWGIPYPIFLPQLVTVLNREIKKVDVVHIHDAFYMSSIFAALIARWNKKPIVLTQHVEFIYHPSFIILLIQKIIYNTTGALVFKLSDKILTYNDRITDFLIKRGVSRDIITLLPNGVDTDLFHPGTDDEKRAVRNKYDLDPEKKIVLFVGRLVAKKGYVKLLAAKSDKYQIVFVGGTSTTTHNGAIFIGKHSQEATAEIYRAADIFALPSVSEGFPLSIQEAMASGLPVITTYDYGYDYYGLDNERFTLLKDPSSEDLRIALEATLADGTKMRAMSEYSHSYALEHFNWMNIIPRLVEIYKNA